MKNKYTVLLYLMILISILLCLPYIIHIIENGTVEGFDSWHAYTYNMKDSTFTRKLNWIIFTGLILIFSVIYFAILKHEKEIFKNRKQIIIFIVIISVLFSFILYYIMYDIFYYIGDAWLCAKYGENPYYTTVAELQNKGIDDEILRNTGPWKDTTSVYGPIWNMIATFLVFFSFGNLSIGLFVFKLGALVMHILNCYLIYKITKSNKYMLLYGLNPLVLLESLSNVHNDIYLVTFILIALFFLIKKKNNLLALLFLSISVATKYTSLLMVPFILIYMFRNEKIHKRIIHCFLSGISIIAFVILTYMPYYREISIFTNMLVQGEKYCQSILAILIHLSDYNTVTNIKNVFMVVFAIIYIITVIKLLFKKNIKLKEIFSKINLILLFFIFIIITNFHEWYLIWLIPTMIYQKKNMRYFIISSTIVSLIYPIGYFISCSDGFVYGLTYSIEILIGSLILALSLSYTKEKGKKLKNKIVNQE